MASVTLEEVLTQAKQLPLSQRRKLKAKIERELADSLRDLDKPSKPVPTTFASKDRTAENEWLKENRAKYVGRWIGLEGNQLIASSHRAKDVYAAAKELKIDRPLVIYIEEANIYYLGI